MSALAEKFQSLSLLTKRREIVEPEEPQPPSVEEMRDTELHSWAQAPECRESFLPMLEDRLSELEDEEVSSLGEHAVLASTIGAKKEVRRLLNQFKQYVEE